MTESMVERITHVAIRYGGTLIAHLPAPSRHHDVIRMIYDRWGVRTTGADEQGFMTSSGRFVSRGEAMAIAKAAAQLREGDHPREDMLFSEDVW